MFEQNQRKKTRYKNLLKKGDDDMKKEDIKKFLWVVMALTLVVFSVGFGGLAFLVRQIFTQGKMELYDWFYNKLYVAIIVILAIA